MKFKLPRKLKKKLGKDFWFYPMDKITETYQMAFPESREEDYKAYKLGILTNL